ncbi:hypothetical protein DTW90_37020 [Neorhizobium sp. P12A]|uniref:O-antigen ligase family protein n=1 Tax=Neorhizobium sp. P12A TaxID=2268027 RepID=UPI0011EF24DA|nr:O-antigen ligase family protein [Neorhizobium sp. P12A]KAA0681731.1 hypothetical protein DTW90_37020 [Neorhizobium sp. P12A]
MAFRAIYILSMLVLVVNTGALMKLSDGNAVEKAFFLLSAFAIFFTRRPDKIVIALMISELALVFVLAVATPYPDFSWAIFINSLNQIVVLFALLAADTNYRDQQTILKATAFMPVLCALLGLIYHAAGINPMFAVEYATGVPRYAGSLPSAAFTSALAMLGVFAAVRIMLSTRMSYMILAAINFMILLAAGGRATLAITLAVCGISILTYRGIRATTKLAIVAVGFIVGVAIVGLFWDNLATRFLESGDSGRSIMWDYLRTVIDQYPNTGIGFGHQFFATPHAIVVVFASASAHNDFLRLSVELGTVGMVVFYAILSLAVLRAALGKKRKNFLAIFAYAGFLLLSNSDNALASPLEFPLMFLALIAGHRKPIMSEAVKMRLKAQIRTREAMRFTSQQIRSYQLHLKKIRDDQTYV